MDTNSQNHAWLWRALERLLINLHEIDRIKQELIDYSERASVRTAVLLYRIEELRGVYWEVHESQQLKSMENPMAEAIKLAILTPLHVWWSDPPSITRWIVIIDPLNKTVKSVFDQGEQEGRLRYAAPERVAINAVLGFTE